jgi:hypothetical protein
MRLPAFRFLYLPEASLEEPASSLRATWFVIASAAKQSSPAAKFWIASSLRSSQ